MFNLFFSKGICERFSKKINEEFSKKTTSPLNESDLAAFTSLNFFEINSKYNVEAKFIRTANEQQFDMKTSTKDLRKYVKYGELHFVIDGKKMNLNLYQNIALSKQKGYEDYLFLPFTDLTNGNQSYLGGRYIDMKTPTSNNVFIDFNKAYNPYCAYSYKYSCPIVPIENNLEIEILAGVKKFH